MIEIRQRPRDAYAERQLSEAGLHPLLARLFASRGVGSPPPRAAAGLLPPAGLLGIDKAARRLADAIERRERIVVVADYDCDGATACAVTVRALRLFGADVGYVVPDRLTMGYGLSIALVELARAQQSPRLLLTVDNGTNAVDAIAHAQALGIDVVVTDHHLPGPQLPDATALVNPNQPGCRFASKSIAGVGVAFYTMLALRAELRERGRFDAAHQPRLDALLDLVAIGTVADVVKLDANNRLLVHLGLERIRQARAQAGVLALIRVAGRDARRLGSGDIGFAIAPRINAAGRIADMSIGIECLLTDDPALAFELALKLDAINAERRELTASMTEQAAIGVEVLADAAPDRRSLVVTDASFHAGVIGLIAGRLKDTHHRPTLVFAPVADRRLQGSGRSIEGFHLRDAIDLAAVRAPGSVVRFGGHAMAAGLTIEAARYDAFDAAFESVTSEWLAGLRPGRLVDVDGPVELGWLQPAVIEMLESEIWGQAFEAPLFVDEWTVVSQRCLKDKHWKATLERDGRRFDAIAFNRPEPLPSRARLAFRMASNHYQGSVTAQLVIEHVL
ncbi:single-stranded-DNA-specific exonuclease RecJ [soil metagenome]